MRKLFLGLALSLVATAASAEWVLVTTSKVGEIKVYLDPATKNRAGNIVKIWELQDYPKPLVQNNRASYSTRIYRQYDCAEATHQVLSSASFSGRMLTGEMFNSLHHLGPKEFIPPESMGEALLNFACK
jgi:hypothetical protein